MTDEEDTAILLINNEVTVTKNEVQIVSMEKMQHNSAILNKPIIRRITLIIVFCAGLVFGYDMAMIFSTIEALSKEYNLECSYIYLLFSIWLMGGVLSVSLSSLIDMWGRQLGMTFAYVIIIVGTLIMTFAPVVTFIFLGRLILGLGCTISAVSHCTYVAEISDIKARGFGITLHQFGVTCGTFISLIVGYLCNQNEYGWRIAISLNLLPAVVNLVLLRLYLPSFPPLRRKTSRFWRKLMPLSQNTILESSFVLISMLILIPWTGRISVLNYGQLFFAKIGIDEKEAAYTASATFAAVRIICTGISLYIVEHLGRRTTFIMSIFIMGISVICLGVLTNNETDMYVASGSGQPCPGHFMVDSSGPLPVYEVPVSFIKFEETNETFTIDDIPPPFPMLPTPVSLVAMESTDNLMKISTLKNVLAIIALLLFESAHALGPDVLIWILGCELFPTAFRGRCLAELFMVKWIIDIFICAVRLYWLDFIDTGFALFAHCLPLSILLLFVFFFVPETTGQTLNQIEYELESNSLLIRLCQRSLTLPWLNKNRWLRRMAAHRRAAVKPKMQRTVI